MFEKILFCLCYIASYNGFVWFINWYFFLISVFLWLNKEFEFKFIPYNNLVWLGMLSHGQLGDVAVILSW